MWKISLFFRVLDVFFPPLFLLDLEPGLGCLYPNVPQEDFFER